MSKANSNNPGKRKKFRDEQKEKRIFEHITNKEDIITEEDIRNVRTDVEITGDESPEIDTNKEAGD